MNDDQFFERLRDDASRLRYEPDDITLTRLAALSLVVTLGVQWYERNTQPVTLEAAMSTDPVEISVDGNVYTLNNNR